MKKILGILGIIFAIILVILIYKNFSFSPNSLKQKTTEKVSVTYVINSMTELPVAVAIKNGYFAKNGLDVKVIKATNGTNNSKVFVSGGADIAVGYPTSFMLATAEGVKIKFIGVVNYNNPFVFISSKETAGIKNVGVTNKGGEAYQATLQFLKFLKLDPESINFTVLGTQDLVGKSLLSGNIDAAIFPESVWAMFKDKNSVSEEFKVIAKTQEQDKKISGLFVKSNNLESKKAAIENFSKSILEANYWIKSNSEENIANLITGVNKISKEDAPYLAKFGKLALENVKFNPNIELIEKIRKSLEPETPKMKDFIVSDFISLEIYDSLKKQGVLSNLGF